MGGIKMDSQKIGQYIAYKRKAKGMTQKQLADALLITNKAVSKWETGTSMPDISLLKELARILEVTVDELLNGEDSLEKTQTQTSHYQTMTIKRSMYKTYLQQMIYNQQSLFIMTILVGWLLICGGYAIYLLNRYLQHHFDIIGLVMMIFGLLCLISLKVKLILQTHFYKPKDIQYQLHQQSFDYIQDGKKISYFYQDIQDIWNFNDYIVLKIQNKNLFILHEDLSYIQQQSTTSIHAPISYQEKIQLWIKMISLIIFVLLTCLEVGYVVILKRIGFEYFFDALEWIVVAGMIISLYIFIFIDKKQRSHQTYIIGSLSIGIIFVILGGVGSRLSPYHTYYSLSPDLSSQLILKQNKTTGQFKDLHYTFLCFGKANGIYDAQGENISTLWLNGDNNLVSYDDHNHQQQAFIATYGDRGNGISYYYVLSTLSGNWITQDNQDQNYEVSVNNGKVEIHSHNQIMAFESSQIEQFGTTAIVCKNEYGIPCYVIALNKNCDLNDEGLIASGGTITIVNVEDQIPVELFCTTYKEDPDVQQQINHDMEEKAVKQINEMKTLLKQDASLKKFQNTNYLLKVETQSQDFFEITRLAYQVDIGKTPDSIYQLTDQINMIVVKAGTIDDFYVEVEADTWMENESTGEIIEGGYIPQYRIMKGDGCYLVRKMEYRVPGDIQLIALSSPLKKDVSKNTLYRFERQ